METHIYLSDRIKSISVNGFAIPHNIREFYIDDEKVVVLCGITTYLTNFVGELDLMSGKGENITAYKIFGGIMIDVKGKYAEEILYEKIIKCFPKKTKATVLSGDIMRVILENDNQFIGIIVEDFPEIIEKDNFCIVKDNKTITIVLYNEDFVKSDKIQYSNYDVVGKEVTVENRQETCEGITTNKKITINTSGFDVQNLPTTYYKKGNFSEKTLITAFLERLLYCLDEDIYELIDNESYQLIDVPKLKEFLGEYDDFYVVGESAVLFGSGARTFTFSVNNGKIYNISDI